MTTQVEVRRTRLVAVGAGSTVVAVVVTTAAAAALEAAGVGFVVDGGQEVPVSGIAVQTAIWSAVGVALAAGFRRWSSRPAEHFVRTAVGLTALSLVPPVVWGEGAGTVVGLVALHLVAAAVMVPALARALGASR